MPLSLTARFDGASPPDADDPHPPGAGIARALEGALRGRGIPVDPFDNWRDAGWSIGLGTGPHALDLTVAEAGPRQWMLQVGSRERPGLFATLMGRRPPDRGPAIYDLAREVHACLAEAGYERLAWRWDGPPVEGDPAEPPPIP